MTELTWDGKYKDPDERGKRQKTSPVRIALPFQTIETVNEKRKAGIQTDIFAQAAAEQTKAAGWYNRLIWGDKKYVLPSLLPEFAGKVNLIYIDPPFDTGANFSFTANIPGYSPPLGEPEGAGDDTPLEGGGGVSFTKQPSVIEQKAYRDTWGRGLDSYLQWFYETAILLRELLAENGSIYVHLDWHVGHYAKAVLDEVFGYGNFRNEIIREKSNPKNYTRNSFGNIHDVIFFYSKNEKNIWNKPFAERNDEMVIKDFPHFDSNGRRYKTAPLHAPGTRKGETGKPWKGLMPPAGNHWRYIHKTLDELEEEGNIEWSSTGNPREKIYADDSQGVFVQDIWLGFKDSSKDIYATQKPEALLERILKASSNENDLILDCFCGSGTTAATSEKLNRRWLTCDLGRFAIHTARKRLLGNEKVKPFVVQNLGKYERQQWMQAEFDQPEQRANLEAAYRNFILDLYHARPLTGHAWLHGVKAGRLVHVGGVDAPVSPGDVKALVLEFWKVVGKEKELQSNGIDVLGWDFAFELNEMSTQFAAENKVDLRFKKIPREVLEKKAVEQGDIRFFELASLGVDSKVTKTPLRGQGAMELTLTLENFIVPPDEVPEDVQGKISHWSQWVDYWAVDWNYRGDTFHNEWQSYRTKQDPKLELKVTHTYEQRGTYQVVVKVIDILGNDTTKLLEIKID